MPTLIDLFSNDKISNIYFFFYIGWKTTTVQKKEHTAQQKKKQTEIYTKKNAS